MDVVVTVPAKSIEAWIDEGDLAGQEDLTYNYYEFKLGCNKPKNLNVGDRVYCVAKGKLIGYSILTRMEQRDGCWYLIRSSVAEAVTISEDIKGFQGFRYRWWERKNEASFPNWINHLTDNKKCSLDEYDCGNPNCEVHHSLCAKSGECWHDIHPDKIVKD
jgi:hypothetical protein